MSAKEVTAIAIKFFGIWLMINVVLYAPSMILAIASLDSYRDREVNEGLYFSVVGSFILIGVVASCILFRVSNSILKSVPESEEVSESVISQKFLLQLLGVFFIVGALSSLPGLGVRMFKPSEFQITSYLYFLGNIFELIAGLYLLIRPEVWRLWLAKLRGRA